MEEKILKFDTYSGALNAAAAQLKRRKIDLGIKYILLVPEKDTLKCEKLLFSGGGAFDIEVYSLTRWFYKLGGGRVLSRTGAVMILKDILRRLDLKCFYRSKNFSGFCARLYDTICRFWDYGVDLSGQNKSERALITGALSLKMDDFKLIIDEFKKCTQDVYVGRAGISRLIAQKLENGRFIDNAHIMAVNFDDLSRAEQELFCLISKKALSFTRFETDNSRPTITAVTEIFKAPDIINCLKAAALRIREKNRGGIPFDEMALITPDLSAAQAGRIMNENDIPFYIDKSEKLSQTRLAEYLDCLIALKRLSRRDFIRLAKNPFSGIKRDDADIFENYVNAFSAEYLVFASPFTLINPLRNREAEESRRKIAEKTRKTLYHTLCLFWKGLGKATSVDDFCDFLRQTLDKLCGEIPEKQKIFGLLEEIKEFLGKKEDLTAAAADDKKNGEKLSEKLAEALKEGIAALELSKLPRTQGCILIGDAGIFKGNGIKHVFVVGFNEGVMPPPPAQTGLLTENETKALNAAGAELPLKEQQNQQKIFGLLQLFADAETLFLSYIEDGTLRPSFLLYTLKAEVKNISYSDSESQKRRAEAGDVSAALALAGSRHAALEQLILNKGSHTPFTCSLSHALGKESKKYLIPPAPPKKQGQKLFFKNNTVSASQLQSYFLCPYKHFIDYGLRAATRDRGEMEAFDIGSAAHKAGELYVKSDFQPAQLERIADEVLENGIYAYKLSNRQKNRLKKEIILLCQKFGENIKRGLFKPIGAELKFGSEADGLKGIDIGGVILKGSIDYADHYDGYIRIIDYKTGGAGLTEKEVFYGRRLQLPLYMRVMIENGYSAAAMLYFVFKENSKDEYRFSGVYLADKNILKAFDTKMEQENAVVAAKIKMLKNGTEKITGAGAMDKTDFEKYLDYALKASQTAIRQIQEGNIAPSPLADGFLACDYCDFLPACGGGISRQCGKASINNEKGDDYE